MNEISPLSAIMERVASWPEEAQAELLQFMIDTEAKHFGAFHLDDEDRKRIEQSLASARRGEFASDEEVVALFSRYRG